MESPFPLGIPTAVADGRARLRCLQVDVSPRIACARQPNGWLLYFVAIYCLLNDAGSREHCALLDVRSVSAVTAYASETRRGITAQSILCFSLQWECALEATKSVSAPLVMVTSMSPGRCIGCCRCEPIEARAAALNRPTLFSGEMQTSAGLNRAEWR